MSMTEITMMGGFDSCGIFLSVRFGGVNLYGEGARVCLLLSLGLFTSMYILEYSYT